MAPVVVARVRSSVHPGWLEGTNLTLSPAITGIKGRTFVIGAPDDSGWLLVLERRGVIRVARDGQLRPEPSLDLSQPVSTGGEGSLLSLAFDPHFATNGYVYVLHGARPVRPRRPLHSGD